MALFSVNETELLRWITSVLWPFVRIGALLFAAPLFGARTVPPQLRIALSLVLALMVAPSLANIPLVDPFSLAGVWMVAREAMIGAVIGFLLQMLFGVFNMAGEMVALAMGLAFARANDPSYGGSVPLVGQYFVIFVTLLFFAMNGHLAFMYLVFDSFQLLPPALHGFAAAGFWNVAAWGVDLFKGAVLVALPATAALLVTNLAMGIISRSAPQLNIFAVGFPVTLLLGLVVLALGLPLLAPQFAQLLDAVLEYARMTLGVAA